MTLTRTRPRMTVGAPVDPRDHGAVGDGTADDTLALQTAVTLAYDLKRPCRISAGRYRITSTITIPGETSDTADSGWSIEGDGEATVLLHDFDGRLFSCSATLPAFISVRDLKVLSTSAKSSASHAFYFGGGLARSTFSGVRVAGETSTDSPAGLFDCGPSSTCDTILFEECYAEDVTGVGYGIGPGSSVWWTGGRVIGKDRTGSSVGIHLYGGNGGVWVDAIDLINCHVGMRVSKDNASSNREVFINQSAFDSCHVGLWLLDDAYCEVAGLWAASCNEANVLLDPTYNGVFTASGGTIFNAGAYGGSAAKDGIAINGGAVVKLDNIVVRNNAGIGVRCPSASLPGNSIVSGCTFYSNGTAISGGGNMDISGNQFFSNGVNIVESSAFLRISDNRGINPAGPMTAPAMPASNADYTYTGNYPVDVYVRGGTVNAIYLNGNAVYDPNGTPANALVRLDKGDAIRVQYTVAPNWAWVRR